MERRYKLGLDLEERKDGLPLIRGTASVTYDGSEGSEYHLYDNVYERIAPGAFTGLDGDVIATLNHSIDAVLGRTPRSLQLRTDERGLHYTITPADTTLARDTIANIKAGNLSGSSFAFTPLKWEWQRDGIKDVR